MIALWESSATRSTRTSGGTIAPGADVKISARPDLKRPGMRSWRYKREVEPVTAVPKHLRS